MNLVNICFRFDFTGNKSIEMNETFIRQVTAITNGNCEIVFMWWDLKMDMTGDVILNNGPSWQQPDPNQAQVIIVFLSLPVISITSYMPIIVVFSFIFTK